MNCINCNKITLNPKFCSRSCSAKVTNKENPKRKITKCCSKCNNKVKSSRHTMCEIHNNEWTSRFKQNLTIGEYREKESIKGKHASWLHSHIRNFARSWLHYLKKLPCAKCGYDKHVELAHIKAISEFSDDVKLSEINSESNVIQLCPNCHWEFDNLDRSSFLQILLINNKIPPLAHGEQVGL